MDAEVNDESTAAAQRLKAKADWLSLRGIEQRWLMALAAAGVLILVGPPLFFTLFASIRGPGRVLPFEERARTTLANFGEIYSSGVMQSTVLDTMTLALGAMVIAFLIGTVLAWLVERTDLPLRNWVYLAMFIPLLLPSLVSVMGWVVLLGPRYGLVNLAIRGIFGLEGKGPLTPFSLYAMILVMGLGGTFLVFLFMSAAFRSMDMTLEEASSVSGASLLTTMRRVTIPMLRPAALSVVLLAMIFAVEQFEVPMLFGATGGVANIFSTRLWSALQSAGTDVPNFGQVAALGAHFLVFTYVLFYFYARASARSERFATVTARGFRPSRYSLGRLRWPIFAAVMALLSIKVLVPLLVVLWTSLLPAYAPPSWEALHRVSLENYRRVFSEPRFLPAMRNSFTIALSAATISVTIAITVAWIVTRARKLTILHTILDLLTSSSVAIPAVVAASGFILYFLSLPVHIYGTLLALVIAASYRMTVAYRINRAGIAQISKELEEQSAVSGAVSLTTLRRIVAPLLAPHVAAAWALLFIISFREFTLFMFLAPDKPYTVGVLLWSLFNSQQGRGAAFGMILTVVFLIVIGTIRFGALRRFGIRQA